MSANMAIFNTSACANVSLDLSESSTSLTSHLPLRVAVALLFSLMALSIVGFHILVVTAVVRHQLCGGRRAAVSFTRLGIARHKLAMLASVSSHHLILAGFCLPLAAYQVAGNGEWPLGPALCAARNFVETLAEMVSVYHVIYLCIDTYILVCKPLKYRLLPGKFGLAMAAFCWAIPMTTSLIALGLGWHTDGIEDVLACLRHRNICIALYSKKHLLFMVSTTILICIPVLITASVVVLREIHRFHDRQPLKNVTTVDHINVGDIAEENLPETDFSLNVSRNYLEIDELPIATDLQTSASPEASNEPSIVTKDIHDVQMGGVNVKAVARKDKSKLFRKRKAIRTVVGVTLWHCLYWVFFLVFFWLLAYDPAMIPLWVASCLTWLRYFNSVINSVILYGHNSVRSLIRDVLKRT